MYDRKKSVIRVQTDLPEIDGVKKLSTHPKSSAFNKSYPCFHGNKGFCVEVENIPAFEKLLSVYFKLSFGPKMLQELDSELQEKVNRSFILGKSARADRLKKASKLPKKYTIEVSVFERNPDVIAEVLERARGECELCGNLAPFKRKKDGTPYLEVHHKVQLSLGGEDSVDNAIAICPNCHRRQHYG